MSFKNLFITKKNIILSLSSIASIVVIGGIILYNTNSSKQNLCIIQFESNGGTLIEDKQIFCGNTISEPDNPSKEGFIFKGWFIDDIQFDFDSVINENTIIKAKWESDNSKEIITISFDSDGGSSFENIQLVKGSYLTLSTEPVKKGYKFIGWYLNNNIFDYNFPINEDINLIARWEKLKIDSDIKVDSNNSIDKSNEKENNNDNTNNNIEQSNEKEDNYDNLVKKYIGTWYLEGYSDVYIDVTKHVYTDATAMNIKSTNFSFPSDDINNPNVEDGYVIYPCTKKVYSNGCGWNNGITISYYKWNSVMSKYNIKLGDSFININGNKFIKNKGNKNKYSDAFYKKTLGTWYLYQNPKSTINITSSSDDKSGTIHYCISADNFNIKDFSTASSGTYGCENGLFNSLFNELKMSFSDNTLTISNNNGTRKFYREKTTIKVDSISLNNTSLNMIIGETKTLTTNILPTNAYDKSVTWSSSNPDVVTINNNGKVIAKSDGKSIITVKTNDGNHKANCEIIVKKTDITKIELNRYSWQLYKGDTYNIIATVLPTNATDKTLIWKSENPEVATVDNNGKVTAISKGTTLIRVSTLDQSVKSLFIMHVVNPILKLKTSIGFKTITSTDSVKSGINVDISVTGGTGIYSFDYIRLYKDNTLIAEKTNTTDTSLFVEGHKNGKYYVEVMVRDSDNFTSNHRCAETTISL